MAPPVALVAQPAQLAQMALATLHRSLLRPVPVMMQPYSAPEAIFRREVEDSGSSDSRARVARSGSCQLAQLAHAALQVVVGTSGLPGPAAGKNYTLSSLVTVPVVAGRSSTGRRA